MCVCARVGACVRVSASFSLSVSVCVCVCVWTLPVLVDGFPSHSRFQRVSRFFST